MFPPFFDGAFRSSFGASAVVSFESCLADAPAPPSLRPSRSAARRSSSFGYSCSAVSY